MNERIRQIYNEAIGVHDKLNFDSYLAEKFAELLVIECIGTIQFKILRNGYTPENLRSMMHVTDIAEKFGINLPIKRYPK